MNERLQYLVQKHLEGKLTLKENIEFSEILADQNNVDVEHFLDDDWASQLKLEVTLNRNFSSILDKVHHSIRLNEIIKPNQFSWALTFQRAAAILIIPLLLSFFAYWNFEKTKPVENISYAEIQCPLGVRTKFQLPDGSTGFLNSGSKLKYPVVFSKQRTVDLSGEAYFDVVHNKEISFHVNTRNLDIEVVGTTFNVIANEDEKIEEIVLQNGKVNVLSKNGKPLSVLSPNEQLSFNTDNKTFTKKDVIAAQYTSWKEGKLVFRNENMQQVACRLSRWYNVEVLVDDHLLDDYTFHATFIDEPLDEVLKLISITTPITYREERRTSDKEGIYLKRKIILRINKLKINQFK